MHNASPADLVNPSFTVESELALLHAPIVCSQDCRIHRARCERHHGNPRKRCKERVCSKNYTSPQPSTHVPSRASVKKIIITASIASVANILNPTTRQRHLTEKDWNEESEHIVAEKGVEAGVGSIYAASKTLAERGRITYQFPDLWLTIRQLHGSSAKTTRIESIGNLQWCTLQWYVPFTCRPYFPS